MTLKRHLMKSNGSDVESEVGATATSQHCWLIFISPPEFRCGSLKFIESSNYNNYMIIRWNVQDKQHFEKQIFMKPNDIKISDMKDK